MLSEIDQILKLNGLSMNAPHFQHQIALSKTVGKYRGAYTYLTNINEKSPKLQFAIFEFKENEEEREVRLATIRAQPIYRYAVETFGEYVDNETVGENPIHKP